jgi:hypothetical protein
MPRFASAPALNSPYLSFGTSVFHVRTAEDSPSRAGAFSLRTYPDYGIRPMPLSRPLIYHSARALCQLAMVLLLCVGLSFGQTNDGNDTTVQFGAFQNNVDGSINLANLNTRLSFLYASNRE